MFGIFRRSEDEFRTVARYGADGEFNMWGCVPYEGLGFLAEPGELFYLVLSGDTPFVIGTARVVRYEDLDLAEAWRKYAERNGEESFEAMLASVDRQLVDSANLVEELGIKSTRVRDISDRFQQLMTTNDMREFSDHLIGCAVIGSVELFDRDDWFDPSDDIPIPEIDYGAKQFVGKDIEDYKTLNSRIKIKSVWRQDELKVEKDAIEFWHELGIHDANETLEERAKRLVCVAYFGDQFIAASTVALGWDESLKHTFAYFAVAVTPRFRGFGISGTLEMQVFGTLSEWSKANEPVKLGGMVSVLQLARTKEWPLKAAGANGANLHRFNARGEAVTIRWFEHIRV